jgi:hypothetical protein
MDDDNRMRHFYLRFFGSTALIENSVISRRSSEPGATTRNWRIGARAFSGLSMTAASTFATVLTTAAVAEAQQASADNPTAGDLFGAPSTFGTPTTDYTAPLPADVPVPGGFATSPGIISAAGIAAEQFAGTRMLRNRGALGLTLSVSSLDSYNDNFQDLGKGEAPKAGTSRGDFTTTNSASGSLTLALGRQRLYLDGNYSNIVYLHSTSYNTQPISLAAGTAWQAGSACGGDLHTGIALNQQSDFAQLMTPVQNLVETFTVAGTAQCTIRPTVSTSLQAQHEEVSNSAPTLQVSNLAQDGVSGGVYYGHPGYSRVGPSLGYTHASYAEEKLSTETYDTGLLFEHTLGTRTNFSSQFGLSTVVTRQSATALLSPSQKTTYDPYVDLTVTWPVTEASTLNLNLSRRVTSSTTVRSTSVVATQATVGATWRFSPKVSFLNTISYNMLNYAPSSAPVTGVAGGQPVERDRELIVVASVNYAFSQSLSLTGQYSIVQQTSTLPIRTFVADVLNLGIHLTY